MNTTKLHINNMYIKYTFVHFAIPFAVEALSFRLRSSFGLLHGSGNLLVILLEVPFLFLCPFFLKLVVLLTINT